VTSLCDLNDMEIPLSITFTGTLVGLVFAVCFPWPFPSTHVVRLFPIPTGLYPWPVWYPLPSWLPAGSWRLGLATGLAGALAGMLVLRAVRFLFGLGRGLEGLGMGDADFMMMAGSFLGWQPVVLAFFISVFPALLFGLAQLARTGDQHMPFVPPLAIGVLLTLYGWTRISPGFREFFFQPLLLLVVGAIGGLFLLVAAFLLRLVRGTPEASDDQPALRGPESAAGQQREGGTGA
jgi:prepilin signal peptidase PulO-like enzyme (type II secretory pathway)